MNNDDLINSVLREYGYEGLIDNDNTTSVTQVEGGTLTAQRPLETNNNQLQDLSDATPVIDTAPNSDAPPAIDANALPPTIMVNGVEVDIEELRSEFSNLLRTSPPQYEISPELGTDTENGSIATGISADSTFVEELYTVAQLMHSTESHDEAGSDSDTSANVTGDWEDLDDSQEENDDTTSENEQNIPEIVDVDYPLIAENHTSYMFDEKTLRFSGADWFDAIQKQMVTLAGLGGIGSWVALMLSRMQPLQIVLYDDDVVERSNLAGQFYTQDIVGVPKVDGIAKMMENFSDFKNVVAIRRRIIANSDIAVAPIMICGFDNMMARLNYFNIWKNYVASMPKDKRHTCLFVDGRLNMEEFQIFSIMGSDELHIKEYEKTALFSDAEIADAVCSMKQTTFCSAMIGSLIANIVVNFLANQEFPTRSLPYLLYYNAAMMYFKTQTQ